MAGCSGLFTEFRDCLSLTRHGHHWPPSTTSVEDAVVDTRGTIDKGKVLRSQVTLKVGFAVEE